MVKSGLAFVVGSVSGSVLVGRFLYGEGWLLGTVSVVKMGHAEVAQLA